MCPLVGRYSRETVGALSHRLGHQVEQYIYHFLVSKDHDNCENTALPCAPSLDDASKKDLLRIVGNIRANSIDHTAEVPISTAYNLWL